MLQSESSVALGDGARTTVESWGTQGPVVLCVHGITSSRRSWTRLGERLSETHRVYAYDQRGHGDSADVAGPMTLERSVADLEAVAATLPEAVHLLVGHSWGGAVALLGGLSLRPARVVAVDPMIRVTPGTFDSEYVDDLRDLFAHDPAAREPGIRDMYEGLDRGEVKAKLHAITDTKTSPLEHLGRENDVDGGTWDLRDRIAAYPVPLLVCVAGIESVLSAQDVAFLQERGGPNVSMHEFPNEGHNLHRSAFDEFARAVEAFA
ncbi:MAG: alpha/beta fold hydrolase [Vulcanimicrobiaceae bacterium]